MDYIEQVIIDFMEIGYTEELMVLHTTLSILKMVQ